MRILTITEEELRGILREELQKLSLNKPSPAEPRKYLSVKELAGYIHLSTPAIYQRVAEASIPFKRAGTRILFEVDAIDHWLEDSRPTQYFK
jgi:excisionase family DNA binding protein